METLATVKTDLSDIRFYYGNARLFENAAENGVKSMVYEKVCRYNAAIKNAPAKLFAVYVHLYMQGNTQAELAEKWGFTEVYIEKLNKKLKTYFLQYFEKGEKQ